MKRQRPIRIRRQPISRLLLSCLSLTIANRPSPTLSQTRTRKANAPGVTRVNTIVLRSLIVTIATRLNRKKTPMLSR
ncbi:secreted protein [gut metagenome]|uniref:Secreted protein n=1 Tax=gut metagenome TaxID=749906 RepID=J9CF16_9ZZZZ